MTTEQVREVQRVVMEHQGHGGYQPPQCDLPGAATPEPAAWILVGFALIGLALFRKKRVIS